MELLENLPLVTVDKHHKLHEAVVVDFLKLQQSAKKAGVSLDIASSYRPIERQLDIWNQKWTGQRPAQDRNGKVLDMSLLSDIEKLEAILIWSALPGASRHHWGTDLDVYDAPAVALCEQPLALVPEEYTSTGPCGRLKRWMNDHLEEHGFHCPFTGKNDGVAFEPWHISHNEQAAVFQKALTRSALAQLISSLTIEGKQTILDNLDDIFERFVVH